MSEFNGYCASKLFKVYYPDRAEDFNYDHREERELVDSHIQELQHDVMMDRNTEKAERDVQLARDFVKALKEQSEDIDYYIPVWEGLLAVEDDYTFLSAFFVVCYPMLGVR